MISRRWATFSSHTPPQEGFRQITYNAKDQKNAELLKPILNALPTDVPYIATHVWPSQAAIHAGMTHVVNAIPDNWAMALHLSEGAIHTVQTPFAYLGYKMMNGFSKKDLKGMPEKDLKMVGRYVDHELLVNVEEDNALRVKRANENAPMRFLMTVGGAGAGFDQFLSMVKHLVPLVRSGKAAVFINFGDHKDVYEHDNNVKYFIFSASKQCQHCYHEEFKHLTREEYEITQLAMTEPPFSGKYDKNE